MPVTGCLWQSQHNGATTKADDKRRRQCVAAAALVANVAAAAELQMLSFFFGVHGHQQLVCDSHTHTHTHTHTYTNRLNISMSHLVVVAGRRRQRLISTTLFCSLNALSFAFLSHPLWLHRYLIALLTLAPVLRQLQTFFLFLSLYTHRQSTKHKLTHIFSASNETDFAVKQFSI